MGDPAYFGVYFDVPPITEKMGKAARVLGVRPTPFEEGPEEIATPEYYPLSLNALVNACNQKSNREPVVSYDEDTVETALAGLRAKG